MKVYLANPLGFSEFGRLGIDQIKQMLHKHNVEMINPFEESAQLGKQISDIEEQFEFKKMIHPIDLRQELRRINMDIGEKNCKLINSADIIIAILDGVDVDSGTASEIGYAFAKGKIIYGYRGDFRYSRDNIGSNVNLQVEYFIKVSGGLIFKSLNELEQFLKDNNII